MTELELIIEGNTFIELNKLLKIMRLVESGGQANLVITDGLVSLNDEIEFRKRKKIKVGDTISFNGIKVRVT